MSHKLVQRDHFGFEGVEQGWNTTKGVQTDHLGPFFKMRMVQKLAFGLKNFANRGQKRLKYNKIGKIGLNFKKMAKWAVTRLEQH